MCSWLLRFNKSSLDSCTCIVLGNDISIGNIVAFDFFQNCTDTNRSALLDAALDNEWKKEVDLLDSLGSVSHFFMCLFFMTHHCITGHYSVMFYHFCATIKFYFKIILISNQILSSNPHYAGLECGQGKVHKYLVNDANLEW